MAEEEQKVNCEGKHVAIEFDGEQVRLNKEGVTVIEMCPGHAANLAVSLTHMLLEKGYGHVLLMELMEAGIPLGLISLPEGVVADDDEEEHPVH